MAVLKCKMCGGDLEATADVAFATCKYCGSKQTIPSANDDLIQNLFNRANHLRIKCEFDKAAEVYEKILHTDDSEAEAHWGLVLCKYGIEYVQDPKTGARIPTCHRTSYDAVAADADYLAAIKYAAPYQADLYEAEAKAIDVIQKNILNIVKNEKPFDVFLCYKETDEHGRRTVDSAIANDIYHQLTQEGFKVFYAAITLEDKLGQEYEPYIFAALNSAKVMLVIGTEPAYFTATWVKNEWSRFLKLISTHPDKLLIPCYRNMDAYELPEEFAHLQAQDMSKIGFINDIVRGIRKVLSATAATTTVVREAAGNGAVAPLLKRAFMFLEDGDWNSANEYCEKVLDTDPENAQAYLGKLMAELHVTKQEQLRDLPEPFDQNNNFAKALRFGDEKLKSALTGYIEHINTRNENARLDGIYTRAKNAISAANTESAYKEAAHQGKSKMTGKIISHYESAIKLFESISGWKDADEKLYACQKKIEELKAKAEAERLEEERIAKRDKKIAIITTSIVCAIVVFTILLCTVIIPNSKYNDAIALMDAGKYTEAISAFKALDGYKDSANKITECNTAIPESKYNDAIALMDAGKYTEAISAFEALDGYKDSATKITECKYNDAIALMDAGKYAEAITAFEVLDGYKDSADKINECNTAILDGKYNDAIALMDAGNLEEAYNIFIELEDHKDAADKAGAIRLQKTKEQLKNIKVGSYINFGAYEQDNNTSNGKEDVEWLVLEIKDGKALVISKYALDCQPYNTSRTDVTWGTCTLRKWLNNDFINAAFSSVEKAMIPTVTVSADKNPKHSTNPGKATQDQVFLLSITEANKYFSSDSARQCKPTDYADANGVNVNSTNGNCWWWLRSPGKRQTYAAEVYSDGDVYSDSDGDVYEFGNFVDSDYNAVRPALWIDLNS